MLFQCQYQPEEALIMSSWYEFNLTVHQVFLCYFNFKILLH